MTAGEPASGSRAWRSLEVEVAFRAAVAAVVPLAILVLVVGVAQFGAEILVGRHYGAALLFITPLALVVAWIAAPVDLGGLVADRVVETVIGCVVGVAVVLGGAAVAGRAGVTG